MKNHLPNLDTLIGLFIGLIVILGCIHVSAEFATPGPYAYRGDSSSKLRVTRIQGCQYIEVGVRGTSGYRIVHKANCPNHGAALKD